MSTDKRKDTRREVAGEDHRNLFYIRANEQVHEIHRVRDVSISGVGVVVERDFATGDEVAMTYDSGDFQLTINGAVKWCRTADDSGSYTLGIEFDPANGENNSLFFLALRKYLDEFDGTYMDG